MRLIWDSVPRLVFKLAKYQMFFSGITKECHEADTNGCFLDQKSAEEKTARKSLNKNKKTQLFFFENKVQFFLEEFLMGFNIPKEDFSVARGQSLRHSFR